MKPFKLKIKCLSFTVLEVQLTRNNFFSDEPHAREDAARNVLRTLQGLAHIKQSSNLDARVPNGKLEEAIPNPDPRNCLANEILKHK